MLSLLVSDDADFLYVGDDALDTDVLLPVAELLGVPVLRLTVLLEPMPLRTVEVLLTVDAVDLSDPPFFIAGAVVCALRPWYLSLLAPGLTEGNPGPWP